VLSIRPWRPALPLLKISGSKKGDRFGI